MHKPLNFSDNFSINVLSRPKGLNLLGFDQNHPGDIIMQFGEDRFVFKLLPEDWGKRVLNFHFSMESPWEHYNEIL